MKNYLLALLVVLTTIQGLKAQAPCATEMPEEMMEWLRDYKLNNRGPFYNKTSADEEITYIPIKFHIVGNSNGGSYYKFNTFLDAFCTLNGQYAPYNWQFYIYDGINYINNDDLNDHQNNYRSLINSQSVVNVVNIFFVDDPSGACGYFSGYGGPGNGFNRQGYIAIQDGSCASPNNSTIAHEVGHFFSLPHTFYGWEGRSATAAASSSDERVNGSNCGTAGDYFCDTPADYLSDRWSCPYNQTKYDYNGQQYNPDGELYMSYSNDACTSYFSEEQVDAMRSNLNGPRSYLLNHTYPGYAQIEDTTANVLPVANATNVTANYVNLKWKSVENATQYYFELYNNTPSILSIMDTIVADTSIVLTDLSRYKGYKFRVRAFNPYSTCSPISVFTVFTTGDTTQLDVDVNVQQITCNNAYDGKITLDVAGGTPPYTYSWSNGSSNEELSFLTDGKYRVTVTDANNNSVEFDIDLREPEALSLDIVRSGNILQAQVSGGNPSYTYNWNTGSQSTAANVTSTETFYEVEIEDANGCSISESIDISEETTSIDDVVTLSDVSIYPNPVSGGTAIQVEVSSTANATAKLEVYDNTGRVLATEPLQLQNGANAYSLATNNWGAGVYIVRITGEQVNLTRKLIVQ